MYLLNCNNTISGALELFSLDYSGPFRFSNYTHVAERGQGEARFKFSFIVQLYAAHILVSVYDKN